MTGQKSQSNGKDGLHYHSPYFNTLTPPKEFSFDAVMSESCTTRRVFEWTGGPAVMEAVRGVTAVVFAYGQTGSGKTFTLLGETVHGDDGSGGGDTHVSNLKKDKPRGGSNSDSDMAEKQEGIAIKTFRLLLQELSERAKKENGAKKDTVTYTIEVSAVQVYLNHVYDLLPANAQQSAQALLMRARTIETTLTQLGGEVCELEPAEAYIVCKDMKAFEAVLQRVISGRTHSSTHMNAKSSRSHLILTFAVRRVVHISSDLTQSKKKAEKLVDEHVSSSEGAGRREHMSKLILVDLAGNERDSARSGASQEASLRAEGIHVNASLSALSACLRERAKNSGRERKRGSNKPPTTGQNTEEGTDKDKTATDTYTAAVQHTKPSKSGAGLYRTSALTRLLKEPLTRAKIFFLACCSPVASSASTTGQTLTYAAMVKRIKTSAEDCAMLLEQGMDRFPIEFLPHSTLVKRGQIPRSNELLTIYLHELRVSVVRVMVSHRWLSPSPDPTQAHPDGRHNQKHALMCDLFERLGAHGWIRNYDVLSVVDWFDFGMYVYSKFQVLLIDPVTDRKITNHI
jgi:hypothetical protein